MTADETLRCSLSEVVNDTSRAILRVLLLVAKVVDLSGSGWPSPVDAHPNLSSFLNDVNYDDLSKAVAGLSVLGRLVSSLKHSQASMNEQLRRQEDVQSKTSKLMLEEPGSGTVLPPYQYHELEAGQIRMLELLPGRRTDPLRCKLVHVFIADPGDFEAVSYTWGIEEPTCSIQIDGQSLFVRPNLESALIQFRAMCNDEFSGSGHEEQSKEMPGSFAPGLQASPGREHNNSRRLWIDAICINQNDLYERNTQVRLMTQVYNSSKRLLVWLGVESQRSSEAMDFIQRLGLKMLVDEETAEAWFIEHSKSPSFEETFESVTRLLTRPWFNRAWILQEYTFGATNDSLFLCGDTAISNQIFEAAMSKYSLWKNPQHKSRKDFSQAMLRFKQLEASSLIRHEIALRVRNRAQLTGRNSTLAYWLDRNRSTSASDPRDKVFAILGLVQSLNQDWNNSGYDPMILQVDYTATVENVFSSVVKSIVIATGRLDILGMCGERGPWTSRSWTPDWTLEGDRCLLSQAYSEHIPFTVSANTQCVVEFAADLSTLTVRGLVWDIIDFIYILEQSSNARSNIQTCWSTIWLKLLGSQAYVSASEIKQVIRRTFFYDPLYSRRERILEAQVSVENVERDAGEDTEMEIPPLLDSEIRAIFEGPETHDRTIFMTSKGYIGQALYRNRVQRGDMVCVLLGCSVPMLLRPVESHYELVGEVYLEGIMFGEALKAFDRGQGRLQDFELH